MVADWTGNLDRWPEPFLAGLGHKAQRRMCPACIAGLIGQVDRKSVQPMAARTDNISYDRLHHFIGAGLHHFIGAGMWDTSPLEAALWRHADRLPGAADAWLIIDDTAMPKKGKASAGVAPQYASTVGKTRCRTVPNGDRSAGGAGQSGVFPRFAAMRVRLADDPPQRIGAIGAQHMPGEELWLVGASFE